MSSPVVPASIRLSFSGAEARLAPDDTPWGGSVLFLDGREQSHVDEDPTTIRHEYLRRIGSVVDTVAPAGEAIRVLHLGAGALTLPRYVEATRPGSEQTVVEIERELVDFVLEHLPLPAGTRLRSIVGDARTELERLGGGGERFDAIVLDIFTGVGAPEHLACEEFYVEALRALTPRGVLSVNIGDDPGLGFWADQTLALLDAADEAACPGAWTLCDASMLDLDREGNLVLVAGPSVSAEVAGAERIGSLEAAWQAAGPHPAAVLDPDETEDLAQTIAG